ncbi:aldolase catalytic domain-containing protein [Leisingera sp. McT4-56]|uniref:aldolase catalytic domain-containing protein n=1 Tax=Leisingera sp. McT4-56 TaxID=2881255 RepID=UPI001CF88560|nr:aldolase catalytic domain-containing protein [Leisingera sp. McT4-56]MCB4457213.1 aldolase catalytic domain-containing protein [Leisingera sp. McT4-56]
MSETLLLDCTLRDGGYYNAWDFPQELVEAYLEAMRAARVDVVELGFRFLKNNGFKGACAYTSDEYLRSLNIPEELQVAVMVNGADLLADLGLEAALEQLFPEPAAAVPVDLVRLACHFREVKQVLPAAAWLKERGYRVGFNLMQIADRSREEVVELAREARAWPVEVLYFADSMGSMAPQDTARIIGWLRQEWDGPIGIHTHDNMGLALQNTLRAHAEGATWLDATVTGMGRGPGNARTEELVIEAQALRGRPANLVPLMSLLRQHFQPMKERYGWGTNPYYYLSGKYGIHPTYIQNMLLDSRYSEEDILAVIEHLRQEGGKSFSSAALDGARNFYQGEARGSWQPRSMLEGREVLIIGAGAGAQQHRAALEAYVRRAQPVVIALNTHSGISEGLIDLRAACHPVRLMADSEAHLALRQPLITPATMLPADLSGRLRSKELLDFGISLDEDRFEFGDSHCISPSLLVLAYAMAAAAAGGASRVLLAGFDGYAPGDARNREVEDVLRLLEQTPGSPQVISVTPSRYKHLKQISVYGM